MISNLNYYAMVAVVDDLERFTGPGDSMLLYLPLAHNFGRLMHLSGPYVGYTIAFLPDPLQAAARATGGAPDRLPERSARLREGPHRRRREVRRGDRPAPEAGRLGASRRARGERASPRRAARATRAWPRSTASPTGSSTPRSRSASAAVCTRPSPAAPRSPSRSPSSSTAIDILLVEGYGLTECTTAASTNTRDAFRFGTVGKALPRFEVKLAEDGELLVKSETVFQGTTRIPRRRLRCSAPDGWLEDGRHRHDRRGRLHHDHRPEEGHHRHGRRQERGAAEPRERPQGLEVRLAGRRRRRPEAVRRRPDHARAGGDRQVGGRAGDHRRRRGAVARRARARADPGHRRRGQRRALPLRADQALQHPPAGLHDGQRAS